MRDIDISRINRTYIAHRMRNVEIIGVFFFFCARFVTQRYEILAEEEKFAPPKTWSGTSERRYFPERPSCIFPWRISRDYGTTGMHTYFSAAWHEGVV